MPRFLPPEVHLPDAAREIAVPFRLPCEHATFGVELEFTARRGASGRMQSISTAIACLRDAGLNVGSGSADFNVVPDGTVTGGEIRTPILHGENGLRAVIHACNALNAQDFEVNRACGLHVHHGLFPTRAMVVSRRAAFGTLNVGDGYPDVDLNPVSQALFRRYARAESVLDSLMPESRRASNSRWAKSLLTLGRQSYSPPSEESLRRLFLWMDAVENGGASIYNARIAENPPSPPARGSRTRTRAVSNGNGTTRRSNEMLVGVVDKYHKVNFVHAGRGLDTTPTGTVEFRQHAGTTNARKICAWVALTQAMTLVSIDTVDPWSIDPLPYEFGEFFGMLRTKLIERSRHLGLMGDGEMETLGARVFDPRIRRYYAGRVESIRQEQAEAQRRTEERRAARRTGGATQQATAQVLPNRGEDFDHNPFDEDAADVAATEGNPDAPRLGESVPTDPFDENSAAEPTHPAPSRLSMHPDRINERQEAGERLLDSLAQEFRRIIGGDFPLCSEGELVFQCAGFAITRSGPEDFEPSWNYRLWVSDEYQPMTSGTRALVSRFLGALLLAEFPATHLPNFAHRFALLMEHSDTRLLPSALWTDSNEWFNDLGRLREVDLALLIMRPDVRGMTDERPAYGFANHVIDLHAMDSGLRMERLGRWLRSLVTGAMDFVRVSGGDDYVDELLRQANTLPDEQRAAVVEEYVGYLGQVFHEALSRACWPFVRVNGTPLQPLLENHVLVGMWHAGARFARILERVDNPFWMGLPDEVRQRLYQSRLRMAAQIRVILYGDGRLPATEAGEEEDVSIGRILQEELSASPDSAMNINSAFLQERMTEAARNPTEQMAREVLGETEEEANARIRRTVMTTHPVMRRGFGESMLNRLRSRLIGNNDGGVERGPNGEILFEYPAAIGTRRDDGEFELWIRDGYAPMTFSQRGVVAEFAQGLAFVRLSSTPQMSIQVALMQWMENHDAIFEPNPLSTPGASRIYDRRPERFRLVDWEALGRREDFAQVLETGALPEFSLTQYLEVIAPRREGDGEPFLRMWLDSLLTGAMETATEGPLRAIASIRNEIGRREAFIQCARYLMTLFDVGFQFVQPQWPFYDDGEPPFFEERGAPWWPFNERRILEGMQMNGRGFLWALEQSPLWESLNNRTRERIQFENLSFRNTLQEILDSWESDIQNGTPVGQDAPQPAAAEVPSREEAQMPETNIPRSNLMNMPFPGTEDMEGFLNTFLYMSVSERAEFQTMMVTTMESLVMHRDQLEGLSDDATRILRQYAEMDPEIRADILTSVAVTVRSLFADSATYVSASEPISVRWPLQTLVRGQFQLIRFTYANLIGFFRDYGRGLREPILLNSDYTDVLPERVRQQMRDNHEAVVRMNRVRAGATENWLDAHERENFERSQRRAQPANENTVDETTPRNIIALAQEYETPQRFAAAYHSAPLRERVIMMQLFQNTLYTLASDPERVPEETRQPFLTLRGLPAEQRDAIVRNVAHYLQQLLNMATANTDETRRWPFHARGEDGLWYWLNPFTVSGVASLMRGFGQGFGEHLHSERPFATGLITNTSHVNLNQLNQQLTNMVRENERLATSPGAAQGSMEAIRDAERASARVSQTFIQWLQPYGRPDHFLRDYAGYTTLQVERVELSLFNDMHAIIHQESRWEDMCDGLTEAEFRTFRRLRANPRAMRVSLRRMCAVVTMMLSSGSRAAQAGNPYAWPLYRSNETVAWPLTRTDIAHLMRFGGEGIFNENSPFVRALGDVHAPPIREAAGEMISRNQTEIDYWTVAQEQAEPAATNTAARTAPTIRATFEDILANYSSAEEFMRFLRNAEPSARELLETYIRNSFGNILLTQTAHFTPTIDEGIERLRRHPEAAIQVIGSVTNILMDLLLTGARIEGPSEFRWPLREPMPHGGVGAAHWPIRTVDMALFLHDGGDGLRALWSEDSFLSRNMDSLQAARMRFRLNRQHSEAARAFLSAYPPETAGERNGGPITLFNRDATFEGVLEAHPSAEAFMRYYRRGELGQREDVRILLLNSFHNIIALWRNETRPTVRETLRVLSEDSVAAGVVKTCVADMLTRILMRGANLPENENFAWPFRAPVANGGVGATLWPIRGSDLALFLHNGGSDLNAYWSEGSFLFQRMTRTDSTSFQRRMNTMVSQARNALSSAVVQNAVMNDTTGRPVVTPSHVPAPPAPVAEPQPQPVSAPSPWDEGTIHALAGREQPETPQAVAESLTAYAEVVQAALPDSGAVEHARFWGWFAANFEGDDLMGLFRTAMEDRETNALSPNVSARYALTYPDAAAPEIGPAVEFLTGWCVDVLGILPTWGGGDQGTRLLMEG